MAQEEFEGKNVKVTTEKHVGVGVHTTITKHTDDLGNVVRQDVMLNVLQGVGAEGDAKQ